VLRTISILAVLAAACVALIWFWPLLGAIVTIAVAAGVFLTYTMSIFGGYVRRRTDETYGQRKSMWGFWD
jgi:hypothetical protein